MKVYDVLACSFSRWYAILSKVTFKSVRVPLPKEFIDYLLADNVVLPSHLPGLKNRAGALEDDDDNDSDDDDGWDDASDQQLEVICIIFYCHSVYMLTLISTSVRRPHNLKSWIV